MASCFFLKDKSRYAKEAIMLLKIILSKEDNVAKKRFFNTKELNVSIYQLKRNTFAIFGLRA